VRRFPGLRPEENWIVTEQLQDAVQVALTQPHDELAQQIVDDASALTFHA
jgi:hypothetical protein